MVKVFCYHTYPLTINSFENVFSYMLDYLMERNNDIVEEYSMVSSSNPLGVNVKLAHEINQILFHGAAIGFEDKSANPNPRSNSYSGKGGRKTRTNDFDIKHFKKCIYNRGSRVFLVLRDGVKMN
jgi:hypothetical protein